MHAHRAIRANWLDGQNNIKAEAFRRRHGIDDDGLSVASSHETAKLALIAGKGVAALRIDAIENLQLELFREDDDHGLIRGLPDPQSEDYNLVMNIADKLASISAFTYDPWKRAPATT
jgi:hypothetical protein